jgi:uncharacterized coiled-coil protein SlyX
VADDLNRPEYGLVAPHLPMNHPSNVEQRLRDALARKDAEIDDLEWVSAWQMNALHSRIVYLRGTIEQLQSRLAALRERVERAPVAEVSHHAHLGPVALVDADCPELYGKRVRLLPEEVNDGQE